MRIERRSLGNTLLKQQSCGLKERVGLESLLHRTAREDMGQGQKAHGLVMGHVGPDHGAGLSARLA